MPRLPDSLERRLDAMTPERRRWTVTGLFVLLQILIWVLLELFYYHARPITDTSIYFHYAGRMVDGLTPYSDFAVEYPPVAMLFFLLPRWLSGASYNLYVYWFEIEMLLFSCANVALAGTLAWRRARDAGKLAAALSLYSLFTVMIGFIIAARFDIAASFLILATVAAFIYDRRAATWVLVGVGIMTKVVPLFLAPLFLIMHYRRGEKRWLLIGPLVMLVTAAAIALPFLIASWEGLARAFLYHLERPLQIESTWSTPILLMSYLGYGLRMFLSYGSHNLFTPLANLFATLSGIVTMGVIAIGYWTFFRRLPGGGARRGRVDDDLLLRFAAAAIVIFIAGGKVLSPQFLIWLLPLVPLVYGGDRNYIQSFFGLILVMTQVEFPFFYGDLLAIDPLGVGLVAVRNLLLVWLVVILVRQPVPRDGLFGLYRLEEKKTPA